MNQVVASMRRCSRRRISSALIIPDVHVDHMLVTSIDEDGGSTTVDVVEASTNQRKTPVGEVNDRWRDVQLAIEPWLHGVLIRCGHVRQVVCLERSDVAGNQLLLKAIIVSSRDDE